MRAYLVVYKENPHLLAVGEQSKSDGRNYQIPVMVKGGLCAGERLRLGKPGALGGGGRIVIIED